MEPIAIIRGGIGALAFSNFVKQQCIEYHFYEQSPEFGEVGAGIGISESEIELQRKPGLKEAIVK